MAAENQAANQVARRHIDRARHDPRLDEHRLRLGQLIEERDVEEHRDDNASGRRDNRQHGPAPRMEIAASQRGFHHFLGHDREKKDDADLVDREVERV